MGTKVAPTYATLVMGYLEETIFMNLQRKYGAEVAINVRNNWMRFLDDCFIIWNTSLLSLLIERFCVELNSLHPRIQFTMDVSEKEFCFLDVLLKLQEGFISTDIYFKPTDTHLYLNFKSCHPKHTKINIPFCLAARVVTLVSDPEQQKICLAELRKFLKRQDYPKAVIGNGVERAKSKGPISGSQERQKSEDSVIPLVSTYNPNNTKMIPFIRSCEPLLKQSSRMKLILDNYKILR